MADIFWAHSNLVNIGVIVHNVWYMTDIFWARTNLVNIGVAGHNVWYKTNILAKFIHLQRFSCLKIYFVILFISTEDIFLSYFYFIYISLHVPLVFITVFQLSLYSPVVNVILVVVMSITRCSQGLKLYDVCFRVEDRDIWTHKIVNKPQLSGDKLPVVFLPNYSFLNFTSRFYIPVYKVHTAHTNSWILESANYGHTWNLKKSEN